MIRNQLEMSRINAVRLFKHGTCQTAVGLSRPSTCLVGPSKEDVMAGIADKSAQSARSGLLCPGMTKQHAALAVVAAIFLVEKSLRLHRQVHLVLEGRVPAGCQKPRIVC